MAYKNKHIINFGLDEEDYNLLMSLYKQSHSSSIADFFRFMIRTYKFDNKTIDNVLVDISVLRKDLFGCLGVIEK